MQATYQDRLQLTDANLRWMGAFGQLHGELERILYARIARGDNPLKIKKAFCAEFGITSRQYNALRLMLEGKISSTVELLKLNQSELSVHIASTIKSIEKIETDTDGKLTSSVLAKIALDEIAKAAKENKKVAKKRAKKDTSPTNKRPLSPLKFKEKQRVLFGKEKRLNSLLMKIKKVNERLAKPVPGICFGSRKLFNQQFHLDKTTFGIGKEGFANWRKAWQHSRNHQFFLVGSKDETSGNTSCKARVHHAYPTPDRVTAESAISLTIKVPPALVLKKSAPAFITIDNIRFGYGHEQVLAALKKGTALSYRFHRDDHTKDGWRVMVSTDVGDAKKVSIDKQYGLIGVDFNGDHLAWSRTDRFGNILNFGRVALDLHGKTTEQREALLSEALIDVFAIAEKYGLGIAIEELDFSKKKLELRSMGVKRARLLSGLAYAKFKQLATAKASRLGVHLYFVDPAYTSVAGAIKYAPRLGCTVHQAASGAISRRAQGYSERLPKQGAQRAPCVGSMVDLDLPARNRSEKPRTSWWKIRRCLTQHCAEQVRTIQRSSANRENSTRKVVSTHLLNEGGEVTPSFWESGDLLARRDVDFPDVPF